MHKIRKHIRWVAGTALLAALLIYPGPVRIAGAAQQAYNKIMVFTVLLDKIERFYVETKDPNTLIDHAIKGVLTALDPYSLYLSVEEFRAFKSTYQSYQGIGLTFDRLPEKLLVTATVTGGPAAEAGVRPGDKIIRVGNKLAHFLSDEDLRRLLQEAVVRLEIEREGNRDLLVFALSKRAITPQTITSAFMFNDSAAFIKINRFTERTPLELDQAISRLRPAAPRYLILDLRDNGGGDLQAGIKVVDRFLTPGKMIAFTRGRGPGANMEFTSGNENKYPLMPTILLVNGGSASDAEIVTGALQDWERVLVVGQPTFGKALVQSEFPFQDGSALLLTTARFYTPLGRSLDRMTTDGQGTTGLRATATAAAYVRTASGRLLPATGSIVPDVLVPEDTLSYSPALRTILAAEENPLAVFCETYAAAHPELARQRDHFIRQFQVSETLLRDFQIMTKQMGARFSPADLQKNRDTLRLLIKREVAAMLWGEEARAMVTLLADAQAQACNRYWMRAAALVQR